MANTKPFNQNAYDFANKQADDLQTKLDTSPTAYSGDAPPSDSDVASDTALTKLKGQIRAMQTQHGNEQWYGKNNASSDTPDTGNVENQSMLQGFLGTLQKPLQGIVGAVQSATGKGVKPGLLANMDYNMNVGHQDFGDLLQDTGLPHWASAPLGFAADVALDPVNWVTAGTEALVPRIASGLVEGTAKGGITQGLEAAGRGFTSGVGREALSVAGNVGKAVNWVTRGAAGALVPDVIKESRFVKNAGEKVWSEAERYNALTGYDPLEGLGKGIIKASNAETGVTLGNYLQGIIEKVPGGTEFIDKFKYDPYKYMQTVKLKDKVLAIMKKSDNLSSVEANIPQMMENSVEYLNPASANSPEIAALTKTLNDDIDDTISIGNQADKTSEIHADNSFDFAERMEVEGAKEGISKSDIDKYMRLQQQKTGINWYDNLSEKTTTKIRDFKVGQVAVGEKLMNTLDFMNKWFKAAKVPLNPASHVNNVMSSITMAHMMGIPVERLAPKMIDTYKFLSGSENTDWIYNNFIKEASDFSKFAATTPNAVKAAYGFNPSMFGGKYFVDQLIKEGAITGTMTNQEIYDAMNRMPDELRGVIENAKEAVAAQKGNANKSVFDMLRKNTMFKQDTASSMIEKAGSAEAAGNASSAITDLNLKGGAGMNYIKEQAKAGNKFYQLVDGMLSKGSSMYERYDQSAKLATALLATTEGFNAGELKVISRMVPGGITKADILPGGKIMNGQQLYRLTWDKATDIANEAYMSYSAMPAFVRMMRSMPIVGAPFVSFTYAMIPKTLKTLYHNPEAFNQINQAMQEFGGQKSPLEKQALKSPYDAWFTSPGLLRLPFTDSHPVYVNLANFLPYYSLTMVNPGNRSYKDALPGSITSIIDKGQLFKDPAGQVLFDYFILPHLLSGTDRPESQFGQPLYPVSATGLDKLGYAARSLGEAYTPGIVSAAAPIGGAIAPGLTHYVPSYTYRKIAEGMQDNTPLGIPKPAGEGPSLVAKGLAGAIGIPYNQMNLALSNSKKKKK